MCFSVSNLYDLRSAQTSRLITLAPMTLTGSIPDIRVIGTVLGYLAEVRLRNSQIKGIITKGV